MKFPWFNKKSNEEKRSVDVNAVLGSEAGCAGSLSNQIHQYFYPTGLTLAPLFAAINIISNSCATIPWRFFDVKEAAPLKHNHYLYHLFDNVVVSQFMSIKNAIKDVLVHGNGFLYILRDDASGRPISLIYMPSNNVNINVDIKTGVPYYSNNSMSYLPKYIRAEDMIHFKMHTDDGIRGIGLPICARTTIETAAYTENAITNYMSSGGNVTGILTPNSTNPNVPTTKKQINEIRQSWDEARANKGSSTIILPADLKFTQLSTSAKDAALIDTRLYNLQEIARWFNISPVLLGDLSHSQYNSISEAQREFVEHTLQPFIVMMEQELNDKLIMPSKKGIEKIDIDERAILVQDKEKQANYLINLVTKGIITPNEARKELDLPEVEGADSLIIAYTNVNDNQVADDQKEQVEEKQDKPVEEPKDEPKDEPKEEVEEEPKEESRSKDLVKDKEEVEDQPKKDEPKEEESTEEQVEDDEPKEDESKEEYKEEVEEESKEDEPKDESNEEQPKEEESTEEQVEDEEIKSKEDETEEQPKEEVEDQPADDTDVENSTSEDADEAENNAEKESTVDEENDAEDENKTETTDTTEIVDESESVDMPDIEEEPVEEKQVEDEPKEDEPKEDEPKEDEPKEDEPKEDGPKEEQPKDESKEDEPKEEQPKDESKKDEPKDESKEDEPKDESKKEEVEDPKEEEQEEKSADDEEKTIDDKEQVEEQEEKSDEEKDEEENND